ncbi:MAG: TraR/DksA family transcriptional regulator [Myxococcales bacterium]|nr:TraR/DksA family transcriptional regulator [Myxococcales bacterium]
MDHLDSHQLSSLRARLEDERDGLRGRAGPPRGDEAELAPDTGDRQDAAAAEAARTLELRVAGHERARLEAVEAALARIATGVYGVCEETGEPIPYARLALEPTARYTVEAQELLEEEAAAEREEDPEPY